MDFCASCWPDVEVPPFIWWKIKQIHKFLSKGSSIMNKATIKKHFNIFCMSRSFLAQFVCWNDQILCGRILFCPQEMKIRSFNIKSFLSFFPNDPYAPVAQYKLRICYSKQSLGPGARSGMLQKAITQLFRNCSKNILTTRNMCRKPVRRYKKSIRIGLTWISGSRILP